VPLRDVLYPIPSSSVLGRLNFPDKVMPRSTQLSAAPADYMGNVPDGAKYTIAFGPRELEKSSSLKPVLIRITIVLDDPTSKLTDGQVYEYIFKLGL
jgi:hypothetical protein